MDAFSRQESKKYAILKKQERARIQCKNGHPDMKLKHPDWVRDAQAENPNYTLINKKIKEECEKAQQRNEKFRSTLHAK